VQDNNFKTASDDLYSFHHKVVQENSIQLSGWSTINKYICKKGKWTSSLCLHEFYDIETQSQELCEFAKVLNLNYNAFMICMTLHWKDDPKPLKPICLIDVEMELDL
ncbi:10781_t:CDS:2, partial [Funneliformis geosporum]